MVRTVVGLFSSESEARFTLERLLAVGFQRRNLSLATQETLRAELRPAHPETAPVEPFEEGLLRFFTDLFASNETDEDASALPDAGRPDSAVLAVKTATDEEAERARTTLTINGATDVYQQAHTPTGGPATPGPDGIDLTGGLARVRDSDELDDNGLTTH